MNTKDALFSLVGEKVRIVFFDGDVRVGVLGYTKEFSAEYDYRRPKCFTIGDIDFRSSHVKSVKAYSL